MTIIKTDEWLQEYLKGKKGVLQEDLEVQRVTLCDPLTSFFKDVVSQEIHQHLLDFGFFYPDPLDKEVIEIMIKNKQWDTVKDIFRRYQKKWEGPNIPILIFPSDRKNKQLQRDFQGRSGLSFNDKIFLFTSHESKKEEIECLFIHEYNHVCRLNNFHKDAGHECLLDAMVLEGLAEKAVEEAYGKKYMAKWTSIYTLAVAKRIFLRWLKPRLNLKNTDVHFEYYMYGNGNIPKWAGYNIGYYLVSSYIKNKGETVNETLKMPSAEIFKHSDFHGL